VFVWQGTSTLTRGMKYVVTTNAMSNVLFSSTLKKYGSVGNQTNLITLISSCLSIQPPGGAPAITFGDVCMLVKNMGWGCATPLKNPFVTNVVVSPFLLPKSFSSSLTHNQLQGIFGNENLVLSNVSGIGGAFLYQQLLTNTLAGTLPIDLVQISSTGDIAYITPSSVNLISSKGVTLQDYTSYPYCLAHNAILCRPGFFASVGQRCTRCPASRSTNASPAEQMMCVGQSGGANRRLLSGGQMPPSVEFSGLVGGDVSQAEVDLSLCYYMSIHCVPCPTSSSQISQKNPTNSDADAVLAPTSAAPTLPSLSETLLHSYAAATGVTLSDDRSEYSLTMAHPELNLVNTIISDPTCKPISIPTTYYALRQLNISAADFRSAASACDFIMYRGAIRRMVRCLIMQIRTLTVPMARAADVRRRSRSRSLLDAGAAPIVIPSVVPHFAQQNDIGITSSTPVVFGGGAQPNQTTSSGSSSLTDANPFTIAIIAGVVGAVVLVVIAIVVVCVVKRKRERVLDKQH
jgi:hypothetical protein